MAQTLPVYASLMMDNVLHQEEVRFISKLLHYRTQWEKAELSHIKQTDNRFIISIVQKDKAIQIL